MHSVVSLILRLGLLVRLYLSKVDFIENDLIGMSYAVEACDEGEYGNYYQGKFIVPI